MPDGPDGIAIAFLRENGEPPKREGGGEPVARDGAAAGKLRGTVAGRPKSGWGGASVFSGNFPKMLGEDAAAAAKAPKPLNAGTSDFVEEGEDTGARDGLLKSTGGAGGREGVVGVGDLLPPRTESKGGVFGRFRDVSSFSSSSNLTGKTSTGGTFGDTGIGATGFFSSSSSSLWEIAFANGELRAGLVLGRPRPIPNDGGVTFDTGVVGG